MIRRVQQSRRLNYLSLPTDWVKTNNLIKGSEVNVLKQGSDLLIKPVNVLDSKPVELRIKYYSPMSIIQLIRSCLQVKSNEIIINLVKPFSDDNLRELGKNLKFYGINNVEISRNSVKIINTNQEFDFVKVSSTFIGSVINALNAYLDGDKELFLIHTEKVQVNRVLIRQAISASEKNTPWLMITECLGGLVHTLEVYLPKKLVNKILEKSVDILHGFNSQNNFDELLKLYDDVKSLKELVFVNGAKIAVLDLIYKFLMWSVRELMTSKVATQA